MGDKYDELVARRKVLWDVLNATIALAERCGVSAIKTEEYTDAMYADLENMDRAIDVMLYGNLKELSNKINRLTVCGEVDYTESDKWVESVNKYKV